MKKYRNIYSLGALALFLGVVVSCSEEEPLNMAPSFNLNEMTNVMRTSATFNGSISGDFNHISEYGFQYSQSEDFTANLTDKAPVGQKPSSSLCQITVTGLEADKRYYYRLYATTGATTVYSDSEYFQTNKSSEPFILPLEVDSVGENSARFRCTIQDIGDEYLIEYGVGYKKSGDKTFVPVASDSIIPASIAGAENTFYLEIIGLEPATPYIFRPYAKNSSVSDGSKGSREGYGDEVQLQTENLLSAEVETSLVEDGHIGMNSIEVSGSIKSAIGSDGVIDKVGFCWSESNTNPVITDNSVEFDPVKVGESFKTTLIDLKPNTEYYIRAWAKNTVDGETRVGYGDTRTVLTNGLNTPKVDWNEGEGTDGYWYSAYEVVANTITVKATIKNYDENAIVEKGFIWDESNGSISLEKAKEAGTILSVDLQTGGKEINATIKDLKLAKRYYVRAYAVYRAAGLEEVGYSNTYEISTRDFEAPNLSSTEVKDVTRKTATLTGGWTSEGNATIVKKGFCLVNSNSSNYNPELTTEDAIVVWSEGESFTATVENLTPATGYYVRSVVVTEIAELRKDTTYSWYNHFSTTDIERPDINFQGAYTEGNKIKLEASLYSTGEGDIVERGFIWKPDSVYVDMNLENCSSGIATGDNDSFNYVIEGLAYQTYYNVKPYVKSVVENDTVVTYTGWSWSVYMDYSVPDVESPTIEDDEIGFSSATLKSKFINSGSFPILKKGFCIHLAETTSEPSLNNNLYVLETDDSFTALLTGLKHNTRYSVRAFATYQKDNVEETVYSYYRTFTTKSPVAPTFNNLNHKSDSTTITTLYYTCGIGEEGDGTIVEKGFIWKQRPEGNSWWTQYPSFEDDKDNTDDGNDGYQAVAGDKLNEYSLRITGLKPSTLYYVRSYVKVKVEDVEYVYYTSPNGNSTSGLPVYMDNYEIYEDSCVVTGRVEDLPTDVEEFGLCYTSDTEIKIHEVTSLAKAEKDADFDNNDKFTVNIGGLESNTRYRIGFYLKMGGEYVRLDDVWEFTTRRIPSVTDNVSPGKKEDE